MCSGPVPWTLATSNGLLMKTNKSTLMHELEKGINTIDRVPTPIVPIFDGMASFVRRFNKCAGLTYNELADDLLKFAIASSRGAKRIDILFDVYRDMQKEDIAQLVNCSSRLLLDLL